jgi:hypothetical protein
MMVLAIVWSSRAPSYRAARRGGTRARPVRSTGRIRREGFSVLDTPRLLGAASRLRRSIASPVSAALAYTALCLVGLVFAVCLEKMPDIARAHLARVVDWFS